MHMHRAPAVRPYPRDFAQDEWERTC